MSITFYIPGYLRNFTGGRSEVELQTPARTVGKVLESLWAAHPALRDRIVTEQGLLREHLNIFVGNENIRFTGGLSTAVDDGSEITIVPAVSGGVEESLAWRNPRAGGTWRRQARQSLRDVWEFRAPGRDLAGI